MASPDEKRYPTSYWNLVGVVVFIWISFAVVAVQALHDDARGEAATDKTIEDVSCISENKKKSKFHSHATIEEISNVLNM
ncbi:hypothetical protein Bhyg_12317 [Pseudolycoriella hygida]|uniref:Uncharacterized protein n=1 Tax=Pseudolycoriella hygida TaxID=35572 RepID=A0A9Q0RZ68_9DIPT|nr:hypothetical protein Bhyg_12317 [Pseudolycoriella hygida]